MSTWIYAALPEHGYNPNQQPPHLVVKDTANEPRFSGMIAERIADILNAETVQVRSKVSTWQAKSVLLKTGEWGGIVLLSRRNPPDGDAQQQQLVAAAITAIAAMEQTSELDMDEAVTYAAVSGMLNGFVMAGVLSAATRDKLVGMANLILPKWEPPLTADIISAAQEL